MPEIVWVSWHVWVAAHKPGADAPERREEQQLSIETSIGTIIAETGQPYPYRRPELVEPDWTRFPGWADVTAETAALESHTTPRG